MVDMVMGWFCGVVGLLATSLAVFLIGLVSAETLGLHAQGSKEAGGLRHP